MHPRPHDSAAAHRRWLVYCHDPAARRRELARRVDAIIEERYEHDTTARVYGLSQDERKEIRSIEERKFIHELKQFLTLNPGVEYRQF